MKWWVQLSVVVQSPCSFMKRSESSETVRCDLFCPEQQNNRNNVPVLLQIANYVWRVLQSCFERIYEFGVYHRLFLFYLLWTFMHFISAHLYVRFCAQWTWYGFLMSPFTAQATHCQAIRFMMNNGANSINALWVFFSSVLLRNFINPPPRRDWGNLFLLFASCFA